jgi:hypothetical protein
MKLVFKKDKNHQISVLQDIDGKRVVFDYVDMIKALIKSRRLEAPDISEGFTEAEVRSIKSMVERINKQISAIDKSDVEAES